MIKRIVYTVFVVAMLAAGGLVFFLNSGLSLKAAIALADRFLPGRLAVGSVQGSLADFTLKKIEYAEGTVHGTIETFSLNFEPFALMSGTFSVRSLVLSGLDLSMPESAAGEERTDEAATLPASFTLPLALMVANASVDRIQVVWSENRPPIRISNIRFSDLTGRGDLFTFSNLEISAPSFKLKTAGQVQTSALYTVRLAVSYAFSPEGYLPIAGQGEVTGSLARLAVRTTLAKPFRGTLDGVINDLPDKRQWQAELTAERALLADISPEWPGIVFTGFTARGNGTLDEYSVRAEADTAYDVMEGIHITTTVIGNGDGLRFTDTRFDRMQGSLLGEAQLDWQDNFIWQAAVEGKGINLAEIDPAWPPIRIPAVTISGGGAGESYNFDLKGIVQHDLLQQNIHVASAVSGDGAGLRLYDLELGWLEGNISGTARIHWDKLLNWQLDLSGHNIDPIIFDPRLPGNIDFHVTSSGRRENAGISADLEIVSLEGQLREYPLAGTGRFSRQEDTVAVDMLHLQSGGSTFSFHGSYGTDVALDFQLHSGELGELWPGLGGKLDATGHMLGTSGHPTLQLELTGARLSYGETTLQDLAGSLVADMSLDGTLRADMRAEGGTVASQSFDEIVIALEGSLRSHRVEAGLTAGQNMARLQADGGIDDDGVWTGFFETADIETKGFGNWRLTKKAAVSVGRPGGSISDFCLQSSPAVQLCLTGTSDTAGRWGGRLELDSLPLSFLNQWPDRYATIDGSVSGFLSLEGSGADLVRGEGRLASGDAFIALVLPGNEKRRMDWKKNEFKASYADRRLQADFTSLLEDGSSLTARAVLTNIGLIEFDPAKVGISGSVDLGIADLKPLGVVTYPNVDPSGRLNGNVKISGSLHDPVFRGSVGLQEGILLVPPLGISLEDVRMDLTGIDRQLNVRFSALSGKGTIHADGAMDLDRDDKSLLLKIRGERFELARLPEIILAVSPELEVTVSRSKGEIAGTVVIAETLIAPHVIAGTVRPSRDVVFAEDQGNGNEQWPLYADLSVIIGDDVRVNAFGLRGQLAGTLQVKDLPGKPVTGDGSLKVENGTFSIYGRELRINTGRLLYSGGPLDNPGVEVRAENTAAGVTTGIMVSGFLQEPQISFYSTPAMGKDEIITRLLMNTSLVGSSEQDPGFIGSVASDSGLDPLASTVQDIKKSLRVDDVKIETGKTSEDLSLVIGTWLTPSLYVSYGKNLLKESGSFHTRYTIGHGFFLETESGTTQSGADLKFEIEP